MPKPCLVKEDKRFGSTLSAMKRFGVACCNFTRQSKVAQFGGIGDGLSPNEALALGLKVDVDALPRGLVKQLQQGQVDLNDPAVTLTLLRHDAVLGVEGFFNEGQG